MKITVTFVYTAIVLFGIILIPNAFAENVPEWVKSTSGWWAEDQISDSDFLFGIKFLVETNIIQFQSGKQCNPEVDKNGDNIPDSFDVNGHVDWSYCDLSFIDFSNGYTFDWKQADGIWSEHGVPYGCPGVCPADSYTIDLSHSNLTGINLKNANLPNALLYNSTLNFANLEGANLENANLKDTSLRHTNFYNANLTNADLSGADLRKAFFGGADLSNANLSGATGEMYIDENTILKCINNPICESG